MIKSGRLNKHGKRSFDMVLPRNKELLNFIVKYHDHEFDMHDILELIELWYNEGIEKVYLKKN